MAQPRIAGDQRLWTIRMSAYLNAMRQMIKTPSPAYSDLLHKMEIAHWNDVTNLIDGAALFLTIVEDLKLLVGE